MTDLSSFAITDKWPAQHPERLQLYSLPTPNGVKVSIFLEKTGLAYEPHLVNFATNDQLTPEFISLNPNNKIPAILDPNGPGGKPLALFESGAILLYLSEKTGQLLPTDPAARYETIQWLMFQMGGIGPMFGQLGFFHKFAGKDYEFWPDSLSLRASGLVDWSRVLGHNQITDVYLLALAKAHKGCLATLDHRVALSTVVGATAKNLRLL